MAWIDSFGISNNTALGFFQRGAVMFILRSWTVSYMLTPNINTQSGLLQWTVLGDVNSECEENDIYSLSRTQTADSMKP